MVIKKPRVIYDVTDQQGWGRGGGGTDGRYGFPSRTFYARNRNREELGKEGRDGGAVGGERIVGKAVDRPARGVWKSSKTGATPLATKENKIAVTMKEVQIAGDDDQSGVARDDAGSSLLTLLVACSFFGVVPLPRTKKKISLFWSPVRSKETS